MPPKKRLWSKRLHKWLGIPLCFFLFWASLSGVLLNHRELIRTINIPRWLLPRSYTAQNWNNAVLRGVFSADGQHYIYGASGVWLSEDSTWHTVPKGYNRGLPSGADYRRILSVGRDACGVVWLISPYELYRERADKEGWQRENLPAGLKERLSDMQIRGDSIILLSRSHLYSRKLSSPYWEKYTLPKAKNHVEGTLLFQLVWALHSGEYLGLGGRIAVDLIGLVLMLLSLTGILYSCLSARLKAKYLPRLRSITRQRLSKSLGRQSALHIRYGKRFVWALLFVCITGWMLRPPLMLGLIHHRLSPWRISALYSDNPWHDRLRTLRYDSATGQWVLYTSVGFYTLSSWDSTPIRWRVQPPVSPMGINLMERRRDGTWLIGSFSGLFTLQGDSVLNYFTHERPKGSGGNPFSSIPIAGGIVGDRAEDDILFSYDAGAITRTERSPYWGTRSFAPQPQELGTAPFSLWQWALEIHTGRIYQPLIGLVGVALFIFLLGLSAVLVLLTGYRRLQR